MAIHPYRDRGGAGGGRPAQAASAQAAPAQEDRPSDGIFLRMPEVRATRRLGCGEFGQSSVSRRYADVSSAHIYEKKR
jgi:hypothetical protein